MKIVLFCILFCCFSSMDLTAQNNQSDSDDGVVVLTSNNFDSLTKKGIVLVDFWASWCTPCSNQTPIVHNVAREMKGKILVGTVDVDKWSKLSTRFGISSIPALLIMKNGKVMEKLLGLQTKAQIIERLNIYIN